MPIYECEFIGDRAVIGSSNPAGLYEVSENGEIIGEWMADSCTEACQKASAEKQIDYDNLEASFLRNLY